MARLHCFQTFNSITTDSVSVSSMIPNLGAVLPIMMESLTGRDLDEEGGDDWLDTDSSISRRSYEIADACFPILLKATGAKDPNSKANIEAMLSNETPHAHMDRICRMSVFSDSCCVVDSKQFRARALSLIRNIASNCLESAVCRQQTEIAVTFFKASAWGAWLFDTKTFYGHQPALPPWESQHARRSAAANTLVRILVAAAPSPLADQDMTTTSIAEALRVIENPEIAIELRTMAAQFVKVTQLGLVDQLQMALLLCSRSYSPVTSTGHIHRSYSPTRSRINEQHRHECR